MDNNENYKQYELKEGIVFLIELSDDIHKPLENLNFKSQFQEILIAINELMTDLLISLPSTGIGIYLYNCKKTDSIFKNDSGLVKLFRLIDINSHNMKLLHHYIEDDLSNIRKLQEVFPVSLKRQDNLPIILNSILSEFSSNTHFNRRKLIWITNNDSPYETETTKTRLWKIINDFEQYRIDITPIFLNTYQDETEIKFKIDKFENIFLNSKEFHNLKNKSLHDDDDEREGYRDNDDDDDDNINNGKKENYSLTNLHSYNNTFESINKAKLAKATINSSIRFAILRLKEIKRVQFSCNLILSDGSGSVSSSIAGDLGCSVKGYTIYNHEKPRKYESIYNLGESSKLVHVKTKTIDETTQTEIPKNETEDVAEDNNDTSNSSGQLKKGFDIGDEALYLGPEEIQYLKNYTFDHQPEGIPEATEKDTEDDDIFNDNDNEASSLIISNPPYLKLLCFRKLDQFNPCFNSSNSIFVTADLSNGLNTSSSKGGFENSFSTFSSLYQGCVSLKMYAIVFGCTKKNSIPSLYALYPTRVQNSQKVFKDSASFFEFPQGFFLFRLPWMEDIRSLPEYIFNGNYFHKENGELVEKFKSVITEFGLPSYQPAQYPNPQLNYFYKVLRMHLLQIEDKDDVTNISTDIKSESNADCPVELSEYEKLIQADITLQKLTLLYNYIHEPISEKGEPRGVYIKELNNHLNKMVNDELIERKRSNEELCGTIKKEKKEIIPLTETDILTAWKTNSWEYFNVNQLRNFIGNYNGKIKKATKKADMISNIIEFLDKKNKLSSEN